MCQNSAVSSTTTVQVFTVFNTLYNGIRTSSTQN